MSLKTAMELKEREIMNLCELDEYFKYNKYTVNQLREALARKSETYGQYGGMSGGRES